MHRLLEVGFIAAGVVSAPVAATPPPIMTIPFRAVGSTALLPVSVNGSKPGWFILDSGGNSCIIAKPYAGRLGLHPTTGGDAKGAGKGTVPYDRYQERVRFSVGGLPLECPQRHVIGLDFSNQPEVIGTSIDGVLGTDFFSTYVVEIDYSRRVVRAFDPASFHYTGHGESVPMTINENRLPLIDAMLTVNGKDSVKRRLLVDSGSQDAVDDDFVLRSKDIRSAMGGIGTGQPFEVRTGRFSNVRIGRFNLTEVPGAAGGVPLIGGEVLRHFTVIFDWPRRKMIFEPDAGFARSLANSDAAGLPLRANPDGTARVAFVGAGTPAERAGFAAGDAIIAIDGTALPKFEFQQVQELFRRDRSYRIDILRNGMRLTLQLDV